MTGTAHRRSSIVGWCLYDWANSAYSTVMLTFVFSVYFAKGVVGDEAEGSGMWGFAIGAAGLAVALLAPILGAIADHAGPRKPWIGALTLIAVLATAGLWFAEPDRAFIPLVMTLVVISSITFEIGQVFYNAMLPTVAPRHMLGRMSGWGWGIGYIGGLACLALALALLIKPDPALFGLDRGNQEHVRATAILVALWYGLFSTPLLLWTDDKPRGESRPLGAAIAAGLKQLKHSLRSLPGKPTLMRFLIASALYRDGLGTLFAVGGLYAAGSFGMDFDEILIFAIGLNLTAGIGAIAFSWVDDRVGAKPTILISLAGLIGFSTTILFITDKTLFIGLALALGIFVGPTQSASRSLLARISPPELTTEMFGLYALTGKSIAFLGPILFGWVTLWTDSQRWGLATVICFFLTGALILLTVRPTAAGDDPSP